MFICLYVYMFICLYVYMFICLYVYMFKEIVTYVQVSLFNYRISKGVTLNSTSEPIEIRQITFKPRMSILHLSFKKKKKKNFIPETEFNEFKLRR